ncbi:MAG: NAD(P)H:quinone oxidoreductase [Nonomuraea sp.]|nr:NAD(P)H:quinone oxidoreductase [Nonomuraea sp.]
MTTLAVIYYASTGTIGAIAAEMAKAAESEGAAVRLRRVAELAPRAAVESVPAWAAHLEATADIPEAAPDDLAWADAVIFGTPTRFGNVSAQLKQFIDTLGGLYAQGLLAGKVYSAFTSTGTPHGGHESTLLALGNTFHHFGGIIVPPGYTDPAHGNPYGTSHFTGNGSIPVGEPTLAAARAQAVRVVRYAAAVKDVAA